LKAIRSRRLLLELERFSLVTAWHSTLSSWLLLVVEVETLAVVEVAALVVIGTLLVLSRLVVVHLPSLHCLCIEVSHTR
jgi:hypothetical protein